VDEGRVRRPGLGFRTEADPAATKGGHASRLHIDAQMEAVWAVVGHHEGMATWSGFNTVIRIVKGIPNREATALNEGW
jgi:hypothetical protein